MINKPDDRLPPEIDALIPHRPPFQLLDEIVSLRPDTIEARTVLQPDDELYARIFTGHYPGNPIMPGVLLCEIVFQAGACLLAHRLAIAAKGDADSLRGGTPVIVRIRDARFKRVVRPGDTLRIDATFEEQVSNAFYLKGTIHVGDKLAVRVAFTCALVADEVG